MTLFLTIVFPSVFPEEMKEVERTPGFSTSINNETGNAAVAPARPADAATKTG
jgi:hypothetical protein